MQFVETEAALHFGG